MRSLGTTYARESHSMTVVKDDKNVDIQNDAICEKERDACQVIQAVNRAQAGTDPVDAIIIDRITS